MRRLGLGFAWGAAGVAIPVAAVATLVFVLATISGSPGSALLVLLFAGSIGAVAAVVGGTVGAAVAGVLGILGSDSLAPYAAAVALPAPFAFSAATSDIPWSAQDLAVALPFWAGLAWIGWWVGSRYLRQLEASRRPQPSAAMASV